MGGGERFLEFDSLSKNILHPHTQGFFIGIFLKKGGDYSER